MATLGSARYRVATSVVALLMVAIAAAAEDATAATAAAATDETAKDALSATSAAVATTVAHSTPLPPPHLGRTSREGPEAVGTVDHLPPTHGCAPVGTGYAARHATGRLGRVDPPDRRGRDAEGQTKIARKRRRGGREAGFFGWKGPRAPFFLLFLSPVCFAPPLDPPPQAPNQTFHPLPFPGSKVFQPSLVQSGIRVGPFYCFPPFSPTIYRGFVPPSPAHYVQTFPLLFIFNNSQNTPDRVSVRREAGGLWFGSLPPPHPFVFKNKMWSVPELESVGRASVPPPPPPPSFTLLHKQKKKQKK